MIKVTWIFARTGSEYSASYDNIDDAIESFNDATSEENDIHVYCDELSSLGEQVMVGRQMELPMSTAMEIMRRDDTIPEAIAVYKSIVIHAYSKPSYKTEAVRQREVDKFRNWIYLNCFKGVKGTGQ